MSILYENEFIKVIFNKGSSDYLLITFSPKGFILKDNNDFYAKNIILNNDINSISIIALQDNWYPNQLMGDTIDIVKNIANNFKVVITYGVSMGGYAAIKYSKVMGATHIIAMMPQWSINPNDLPEKRYLKEYNLSPNFYQDMSIKLEDISGKLYLFYDKYHQEDKIQAKRIIDLFYNKFVVSTPFASHTLGHILIGSNFFKNLISMVILNKHSGIEDLVRRKLKESPLKYQALFRSIISNKKNNLLLKVMDKLPSNHIFFTNSLFEEDIKKLIKLTPDRDRAINLALRLKCIGINLLKFIYQKEFDGYFIFTAHNNFLCYDLLDKKLVLLNENSLEKAFFTVPLKFHFNAGILGIFTDHERFFPLINIDNGKFLLLESYEDSQVEYKMQPFLFYRKLYDFYVISNGIFHATATPKSTVDFGKTHIKNWEKFTIKYLKIRVN